MSNANMRDPRIQAYGMLEAWIDSEGMETMPIAMDVIEEALSDPDAKRFTPSERKELIEMKYLLNFLSRRPRHSRLSAGDVRSHSGGLPGLGRRR